MKAVLLLGLGSATVVTGDVVGRNGAPLGESGDCYPWLTGMSGLPPPPFCPPIRWNSCELATSHAECSHMLGGVCSWNSSKCQTVNSLPPPIDEDMCKHKSNPFACSPPCAWDFNGCSMKPLSVTQCSRFMTPVGCDGDCIWKPLGPPPPPMFPLGMPPPGICIQKSWDPLLACTLNNLTQCEMSPSCMWTGSNCVNDKILPPVMMDHTAPLTFEGVPVSSYIDMATKSSLDAAFLEDVGVSLSSAGFNTSILSYEGVAIFVTDLQAGRVTFTAGFGNTSAGAEAATLWNRLRIRKKVSTFNLAYWYSAFGFNNPLKILWPAEQDPTQTNHQHYVDDLRIDSNADIDEQAKIAAQLNSKNDVKISLRSMDSPLCIKTLADLNCNITTLLIADTETLCSSECRSRVSAYLQSSNKKKRIINECSTQTISNILELDILRCTRHRGEYCLSSAYERMFLPMYKSITSGVVYIESDLSDVLETQCTPCVGKIAHAMSLFNNVMTFIGFTEPTIDISAWHFLKIACLKSFTGKMCFPKLQSDFIKGTLSTYNSTAMCGSDEDSECKLLAAAAYEPDSLQTQGILLSCITDDNGNYCGDYFSDGNKSSTKSLIVSTALGSLECNMAKIAYTGKEPCLAFLNTTHISVSDYCNEVSSNCCMMEALSSNVNRGLYTPNELKKGLKILCPGVETRRCVSQTIGKPVPLQIVVQGNSEFLHPNSQEIKSRLKADVSIGTGVLLTQIYIESWEVISPSSAAITFTLRASDPDAVHNSLTHLLKQKQLISSGLTQEMYTLRYDGLPFHVNYESSVAGVSHHRRVRMLNKLRCKPFKIHVSYFCRHHTDNLMNLKSGLQSKEFCSSECFRTITNSISKVSKYCSTAYAAKLSYIIELSCFSMSCNDTHNAVENISESIKLAQLNSVDLNTLCKDACVGKLLKAYQRYTARMQILGVKVLRDDLNHVYRFLVLKTACVATRDDQMNKCLSSIVPIISSTYGLLSPSVKDVCYYERPEQKNCIRKVLKLATEDILAADTLPSNTTGIFKSQCVLTGSDHPDDKFCSDRYAKVHVDEHCSPFTLNGTLPDDPTCKNQLLRRQELLGCCDWHYLEGHLESLVGQQRTDQRVAYQNTMKALSWPLQERCDNITYGKTITRLKIRVNARFAWCEDRPEDCKHAFTADLLQNTGLHSGNIVDIRLSEGSTVATLSVQVEGSKAESNVLSETFSDTEPDQFVLTNINSWSKDYTTEPVMVLDISADSVDGETETQSESSPTWVTFALVAVGSGLGLIGVFALIKRRQKSPPRDRASSKMTEEPLDLTEMGNVATPSQSYLKGNAPGSPTGEGADTMTI